MVPRLPTRNRRSRRWATPKNCASSTLHARPYPSASISDRSCRKAPPCSLESAPGTFSQTNHRGRTSRTHRMYSNMRPDSPLRPSLFPAVENEVHGLPPKTTSTLSTYGVQSTLVMSPRFGTSGQWYARTSDGNLSISQKATGSQGPPSSATETASIPLNKLMYLNFLFSMMSIILRYGVDTGSHDVVP